MTTPTGRGRVGEQSPPTRQPDLRTAPPARPTPWLGGGAGDDGEWFEADPPTQPLPALREPRAGGGRPARQPDRQAGPSRQAPPLRDVPVRDIADAREPRPMVEATATFPRPVAAPAVGTLPERVRTDEAVPPLPSRPLGPRRIPAPVKRSFLWWIVAMAFAVLAMTLSVVLAVLYAGRYGTSAAGGATVGGILFELLMLGAAGFVVVRMRAGDDWARTLLAGGGGLIALIVAMNTAGEFSFGSSLMAGFTTGIATVRLFEAAAAAVAIWYMFQPGAGEHFDPRGRGE